MLLLSAIASVARTWREPAGDRQYSISIVLGLGSKKNREGMLNYGRMWIMLILPLASADELLRHPRRSHFH